MAFLMLATLSAVVLIVAPLLMRRRAAKPVSAAAPSIQWWTVGYFGALGLAFLLVEIPLIQLYILLVGDATTAFAVVLFAVLLASGVGSMMSPRVPWRAGAWLLVVLAVVYPFLVRWLTDLVLPAPLLARVTIGAVAIAPLGFFMGIMFPSGIAHLEHRAPQLVPWAWGINGTISVISAVVAALLALAFGFTVVLLTGAVGYGLAAILTAQRRPSLVGAGEGNE